MLQRTPSALTERAIEMLAATNDTVSWSQLSEALGCEARTTGRGSINSARRILLREQGVAFGPLRGVGLQRLDGSGKVDGSYGQLRRAHRASRRSLKLAEAVSPVERAQLDSVKKLQHDTIRVVASAVDQMTRTSKLKRIVPAANGKLDPGDIVKLFRTA